MRNAVIAAVLGALASVALHANGAVPQVPLSAPTITVVDGRYMLGRKPVEMRDGQPWVDGKRLESYRIVHTGIGADAAAAFRVALPGRPGVPRTMLHLTPSNIERNLVLPGLFAFDARTGEALAPDALPPQLARYLKLPQQLSHSTIARVAGKTLLQTALRYAVENNGRPFSTDHLGDARIVLVQWWAGWCHPCLTEGTDLAAIFAKTPMPDVRWITVEKDPTREDYAVAPAAGTKEHAE